MSVTIPDLLWPAFRARRAALMAGGIFCLVLFVWAVVAAVQVAVVGYEGGVYVPQSACPDGAPDQARCVRRYQNRELESRTESAVKGRLLMSTVPLALAVLFAVLWWRVRNKDAPAVTRLLVEAPGDVVWVYENETVYKKNGREVMREVRLVLGTIRRQLFRLKMPRHDALRAIDALKLLLPHATFGFDPAYQARFQQDPLSLRKSGAVAAALAPTLVGSPPPWVTVAPQVPFAQLDHVMRSIGLSAEPVGTLVAPGEPSVAAWSAPWARVVYHLDPASRTRALELFAQDVAGLLARISSTGLATYAPR